MSQSFLDGRDALARVSPTFCVAKWKMSTLYLHNGTTHSCYLPPQHAIPTEGLEADPSLLHDTPVKIAARAQMLRGERPAECSTCWQIEDLPVGAASERQLFTRRKWAKPFLSEAAAAGTAPLRAAPAVLEVSFGSTCNFRCSYCSPALSSKWEEEVRRHGPYELSYRYLDPAALRMPIREEAGNPFVTAFWRWWPAVSGELKVFRITGGEPLLSEHTFRLLAWLKENPRPDMELQLNSNLGVAPAVVARFIEAAKGLLIAGGVRKIVIHTSLDAHGARAEYIRYGLDFSLFTRNVRACLEELPTTALSIMSTFNALSVSGYAELLAWLVSLREEFATSARTISLDVPHLVRPWHQSVRVLPRSYLARMDELLAFARARQRPGAPHLGCGEWEVMKLARIRAHMAEPMPAAELLSARGDFFRFFSEHDRRRGSDFLSVFPEMADFWALARAAAEETDF